MAQITVYKVDEIESVEGIRHLVGRCTSEIQLAVIDSAPVLESKNLATCPITGKEMDLGPTGLCYTKTCPNHELFRG
jgi:hypothetical protein